MDVEVHSEGTDHERMSAPMRFESGAPIRRHATELPGRAERVGTERVLLVEPKSLVAGQLEIEQIIDERVGADAANMRGESPLDQSLAARRGSKRRNGVGEGPCRRGVPQILNGRIVVGGDAVDKVERPDARGLGKANIRIVPRPGVAERIAKSTRGWRVVGDLRERADIV